MTDRKIERDGAGNETDLARIHRELNEMARDAWTAWNRKRRQRTPRRPVDEESKP